MNLSADLLIHALGPKGDGIHNTEAGPVYIDRALPGDVVQASVQRGAGGVLRGELNTVVIAAPQRIAAPCPNYDLCGGCTLQHASDEFYKTWKLDIVRAALHKAGVKPSIWHEPVFVAPGTRRRVTFAAIKKKNAVTLGYFRRRTHDVTDIATCLVADPAIMALRARLATALSPILQEGKAADVFIQTLNGQFDLVITGPIGKKAKPDLQVYEAVAELGHTLNVSRISWRGRERDAPEVLIEINPLRAVFGGLTVALPPLAFLQPTAAGEGALVSAVMEALPKTGMFADLFAGCGTFSGAMMTRGPVDAFESNAAAIHALNKSKGAQPLKALQRDLFRNPVLADEIKRYDAIVFDPPRAGAEEQVRTLAHSKVRLLVAVSCNPATFARDARILVDGGFNFDSIKVVDQFTWSHHVECVAVFSKRQ